MILNANKHSIWDIFSTEEKVTYIVPRFQREYIWRKDQWRKMLDDLMEDEDGHFFGSILCVNDTKDVLDIKRLYLVDGQQRLATISLLYAAIYGRFLSGNSKDEALITDKTNLKNQLMIRGKEEEPKIQLSFQNRNFEDYKAILDELKLCTFSPKPSLLKIRRIYKAYQYFRNVADGYTDSQLKDLLHRINNSSVVKIEVGSQSDAYALFESLNNRGVPLSPIDIIKNKVLSELDKKKLKSLETAASEWNKLVENVDDYRVQERFLRQYYNAFRYKDKVKILKGKGPINKASRSNLIAIYEELTEKDPIFIFNELIDKSKTYGMFDRPEDNGTPEAYRKGLTDLSHIGASPGYTLLLYLFTEFPANHDLIAETLYFMVKYFVRRHVTDIPPTRDLDDIFIKLIDGCRQRGANLDSAFIIDHLTKKEKFADINSLNQGLEGKIYDESTDATRFILCAIESEKQTKEKFTDLWQRKEKDGPLVWSIEHIFPEGEDIPKHWVDMMAGGDAGKAKELQAEWVHKLGNLTLTGFNPNLSNLPFEKKRDYKDHKGNFVGYKNGLWLNGALRDKSKWTVDDIKIRTQSLVSKAVELLKLEGE